MSRPETRCYSSRISAQPIIPRSRADSRLTSNSSLMTMPSDSMLYQIVETLAAFRRFVVGTSTIRNPSSGTGFADCLDEEHFRDYCQWPSTRTGNPVLQQRATGCPRMSSPEISEMLRFAAKSLGTRIPTKRFPTRHQLTWLHTDAYLANFLVPRTEEV